MKTRIVQVALCTTDLSRSVRRYIEVFGFEDAGGRMLWGERSARIQELGNDMTGSLWWLVGGQEFLQLELYHHSDPPQRPLPADWLPNSLGWVRWGFAVADFDGMVARLESVQRDGGEIVTVDGLRRLLYRDPDIGLVFEVMEEGAALARSNPSDGLCSLPRNVYVTLSVSDLAVARAFYVDALAMEPVMDQLHAPEMEARWGLAGARRDTLVLNGDGMFLELVQYTDPQGERRPDSRLSDQGIMNIAIGYRERSELEGALERAIAGGGTLNAPLGDQAVTATYVKDPLGNSLEMLCLPPGFDELYGLVARPPAFR